MRPKELEQPATKPSPVDKPVKEEKKEQSPIPQPVQNYGLTLDELRKLQIYP